jgi:outer membrane protein OmpA-like peptidoglycan-associated protein
MAHNDAGHTKKESTWALWLIIPASLLVTLIFSAMVQEAPAKAHLDGNPGKVKETAKEKAHDNAGEANAHAGEMHEIALTENKKINVKDGSLEYSLFNFINNHEQEVSKDKWFNFDQVTFATGSTTPEASSASQLQNIHDIMMAFPKVKLKIGGYTDNVGKAEANQKLSQSRAESIVAELVKLGVPADRLAAEGYGDQHPVGDNSTEEGRAQNRRMALRVTEK